MLTYLLQTKVLSTMDNDDLTDHEIDKLLHRAEARLKRLASVQDTIPSAHPQNGQVRCADGLLCRCLIFLLTLS